MTYKKLLNKLENDTSIVELETYLSGTKQLDRRIVNNREQKELIKNIIPQLIKEQKEEADIWYNDLQKTIQNSKMEINPLRLAWVRIQNNKNRYKEEDLFGVAYTIINKVGKYNNIDTLLNNNNMKSLSSLPPDMCGISFGRHIKSIYNGDTSDNWSGSWDNSVTAIEDN